MNPWTSGGVGAGVGALHVARCRVGMKLFNLQPQVNIEGAEMADWLL